ncbi:General secretion pathway protein C [Moritella viscosa]|nr:General secretion pathway protein C [Moritella viscosa]
MPIHYVFYKFSQKLVDIEIKNNILHISGNEIQGYSKASILEVNLFRLTVGVLKIDDKTYYFLPKEFYVFRFYYFTKKLRNMALIELRYFLDADVIAK